jgi:phage N-6-adenine-methyltransferase
MSLSGFKAQNHPQQTGARGALDEVDDRGTHPMYFDPWNARFGGFTLDAAAAPHNAKADRFFTRSEDGLAQSWAGEKVWCNPPYSDLRAWVSKAWREWGGTRGIVMLLPANRVEQKWWQELIEPYRGRGWMDVEFLPGRMRFERPGVVIGPKGDRPPFGCVLVIWRDRTCEHFGVRTLGGVIMCADCGWRIGSDMPVLPSLPEPSDRVVTTEQEWLDTIEGPVTKPTEL